MKKITNILFLLIGFNSIAQQTLPLNKLERGTNGQIPMCAPSGTINGVLQMYTPTLTVINGTISGSPINGTLTIPTQSTTIQQAINNDPTVNGLLAQSTNSYVTVSVNPNSYNFRLDDGVDITEMNMSSNLIQFLGDVTINGNEALTTTNTTTVTNKTIESPTITTSTKLDYATANRLTYTDAIKNLKSVILGSGLSLSSGTLSATTTASTTTITGSTNVTVSGSAPNYTISSTPTLAISGQSLSISGGNTITIPTGTLTTSYIGYGDGSNNITGSSSLTYSNSILKINPANLPSGETAPLQLGADKMLIGNTSSALNTPSFIEFIKSTGSGTAATMRGSMGYLGASEMNQSVNMDYTTGTHKYYDPTKVAVWSYLGNTNGFGVQYVPANNPNSNIYVNYGCRPFYMEYINQPATGKGINGFSKLYFQQLSFTDATNTSTSTVTPGLLQQDGGILKLTGSTGMDYRLTHVNGSVLYNSNVSTNKDYNFMTPFTLNSGRTALNILSYSTTAGYVEAIRGTAEDGDCNVGVTGKAVKSKANATNVGLVGVASNTNATNPNQIGGYFGLTGVPDATISAVSGGIVVDNGTSTSNIAVFRDNGTNVITVADGGALTSTQNIASSSKTAGIGYAVGSGSTVTQATSRTTGVTINSITGSITLVSAAGSATWQTFTVTNSAVTDKDVIIVNQQSGTDLNLISVTNVAAGSFKISFATTGGTTTEQPVFNFAIIKGQTN